MSQIETNFTVSGETNGHPLVSSSAVGDASVSTAIDADRAVPNSEDTPLNSAAVRKMLLNLNREIRTPLASILGMTQMLLHTDLDGSQKEFVEAVDSSAHSIASIVSTLADASRFLATGAMDSGAASNFRNGRSPKAATVDALTHGAEHPRKDDAEPVVIDTGPPIDPVAMAGLREIDAEDEGFLQQLIDLFLSDMKERLATMKAAVDEHELGPIRSTAHAVKGSSGHFGAARLASWCRKMELIEPENLASDAADIFTQLSAEAELVRAALEKERDAPRASTAGEVSI